MGTNGSVHGPVLEAAWQEECAAAERLREAQTAAARAAHDLAIKQNERKRLENMMAATTTDAPQPRSRAKRFSRIQTWLVALLIAVGAGGFAYWAWAETSVRVCSTSMTERVARDLARAYRNLPYHYTLVPDSSGPCDVRFYATTNTDPGSLVARDGVVAIVNPDTPVHQLTSSQLRDVFTGRITNWSKVGAATASIVALVPPDGSDEARVAKALLNEDIGPSVRRLPASEIVDFIASPNGKDAIGFVPFSSAASAKIVAIAGAPPPSASSIAHDRYPLSLGLMAESDYREPSAGARGLIAFARSHNPIVIPSVGTRSVP